MSSSGKIFISHASEDSSVVNAFYDLLQLGGDIGVNRLFCTSADGRGIETGKHFIENIVHELKASDLAILILSPNYYASSFCLAEMGGAWALGTEIFPFVLEGTPRDPGVVFSKVQSQRLDKAGLNYLHERLVNTGLMDEAHTARWSAKVQQFLGKLPQLQKKVGVPSLVRRSELEEEVKKTAATITLLNEAEERLDKLQEQYDKLKKTKDAVEVRRIEAEYVPLGDQYDVALKEAQKHLGKLPPVVVRAVYSSVADSPWQPDRHTAWSSDITAAMERQQIQDNDGLGIVANPEHPMVERAIQALETLQSLLEQEDAQTLCADLKQEHDCIPQVTNRQFFETVVIKCVFRPIAITQNAAS